MLIEESARERAMSYELLAGIFLKEPSLEQFEVLQRWAAELGEDSSLEDLLHEIERNDPELEELIQTYYDLFFVPVSGRFVPPYEAAIRGAQRKERKKPKYAGVWGTSTFQIMKLYEQIGFVPEKLEVFQPLREMKIPDHIGFELSALAYLCQAEASWSQENKNIEPLRHFQKTLLIEHLGQWLELLKKDVESVDPTGFYTYFTQLASEFCREEANFLGGTVS